MLFQTIQNLFSSGELKDILKNVQTTLEPIDFNCILSK